MQPLHSHWTALATVFGLGAIVGNFVSFLLSSWWQRRSWIRDNKKQEWRELVDATREAIRVMASHYDDEMPYSVRTSEEARHRE